jgi:hypothetical protein
VLRCVAHPYRTADEIVWRYTIAFLKTHLAGVPGYKRALTPGWAVSRERFAMFFVNEKRNGQTPSTEFPDDTWFHLSQPNPDMDDGPAAFEEWLPRSPAGRTGGALRVRRSGAGI